MPQGELLPASDGIRTWSVVHTKPRCEKKVAKFCLSRLILEYLPELIRTHRYGKRVRTYHVPLFTGYLFVCTDSVGRQSLRQSNLVANLLIVQDQQNLITQLNQVKFALDHQATIELLPHFTSGMTVQVKSGPLKGLEGVVVKVKNNTRIILNVDFIQKSIAVEVNAEWLISG